MGRGTEQRTPAAATPLAGVTVLVTRPEPRGRGLVRRIEAAGGRAVVLPAIEIAPPADPAPSRATVAALATFDLAVFVSVTAVERGLDLVEAALGGWPPGVAAAAVGEATAAALAARGVAVAIVPAAAASSEGLLGEPALAAERVRARGVAVFKGEGGRDLIERTLAARGARVVTVDVYRRVRPRGTLAARLGDALRDVDVVAVTSGDAMRNLVAMAGDQAREWIDSVPLVVASARIAEVAAALGHRGPRVLADDAGDRSIAAALGRWAGGSSVRREAGGLMPENGTAR